MSLSQIKVNNTQVTAVDEQPTASSSNLVESEGVFDYINELQCIKISKDDADRDNNYEMGISGRITSNDLFNLFIPLYGAYDFIVIRDIASNYHYSLITYNKDGEVYRSYLYNELKFHKIDLSEDETFCFVNYYIDSYAASNNIPIFDGVYLHPKVGIDISKNYNLKFDSGEYAISTDGVLKFKNYYNSNCVCAEFAVEEDEQYIITGINLVSSKSFIVADKDDNILDYPNEVYNFKTQLVTIPRDGAKLYITSLVLTKYVSDIIIKLPEKIKYDFELNENHMKYRNKRWAGSSLIDSSNAECSDLIPIKNCEYIFYKSFLSSGLPQISFFTKTKLLCGTISPKDGNYRHYYKETIPESASYIAINYDSAVSATYPSFKIKGELDYSCGKISNDVSILTSSTPIKLFDANSLSGCPISMVPQVWGDELYIYCVCEKRVYGSDTGISHIMLSRLDKSNNSIFKTLVFESSYEIGRFHNAVIWLDENGILGTVNRLYVFVGKVNAEAIDDYISSLTSINLGDFVYKYSDDNGETWSSEISLKSYYPNGVVWFGPSPSQPVVLENSTLCLPGYVIVDESRSSGNNKFRCGVIYYNNDWNLNVIDLDDNCETDNECTIAEYGNNSLIVNARNFKGTRSVYYSIIDDLNTYKRHISHNSFICLDSYGCLGSLIKYRDFYLFSYIDVSNVESRRENLCVWITYDLCIFYPLVYITLNVEIGGYSNLYVNDDKVYCVYESNRRTDISLIDITTDIDTALSNRNNYMFEFKDIFGSLIAKHRNEL